MKTSPDYFKEPPKYFLLYGLQRSGTFYLEELMKKNFENAIFLNKTIRKHPTHKHFRLYNEKSFIPEPEYNNDIIINSINELENRLEERPDYYIVISKDPYSWYISYIRWANICNWPEPDYHYIKEWNYFYKKWYDFSLKSPHRILLVKYIDLLLDFKKQLADIAHHFGLKRKQKRFVNIKKVENSSEFTKQKKNYYINQKYLGEMNPAEFERLNSQLDKELVDLLGYRIIEKII